MKDLIFLFEIGFNVFVSIINSICTFFGLLTGPFCTFFNFFTSPFCAVFYTSCSCLCSFFCFIAHPFCAIFNAFSCSFCTFFNSFTYSFGIFFTSCFTVCAPIATVTNRTAANDNILFFIVFYFKIYLTILSQNEPKCSACKKYLNYHFQ